MLMIPAINWVGIYAQPLQVPAQLPFVFCRDQRPHHPGLKGFFPGKVVDDPFHIPDHHLKEADLLQQQFQQMLFDGPLGDQVVDVDFPGLPQTVNPPDPLLQTHGVPGKRS